jgi:predicted phage terminase large subunit-like protein
MVGTILHMDSLLMRFMPPKKDPKTVNDTLRMYSTAERAWKSVLFRAHSPDFKHLLWAEMYPAERLRAIRQDFAEQGMLDVYGQEYLNDPIDQTTAYFRKSDFLPMKPEHFELRKTYYAAGDLAITQNKRSAYTAMPVGGMDSSGRLFISDMRRGRFDSLEISDEIFSVHKRWNIDIFRLESENIEKAIGPFLYKEMRRTGEYINIDAKSPTKDKEQRAQTLRAMMRAGMVYFDKEAEWYPDLEEEMLHFPKWPTVDQVDAMAWLGMLVNEMVEAPTQQEYEDELYEDELEQFWDFGANATTGY